MGQGLIIFWIPDASIVRRSPGHTLTHQVLHGRGGLADVGNWTVPVQITILSLIRMEILLGKSVNCWPTTPGWEKVRMNASLCKIWMVIGATLISLLFCSTNQLLLISIKELCGQYLWSMMEVGGSHQPMPGDNGNGMGPNLWIYDWQGFGQLSSYMKTITLPIHHSLLLTPDSRFNKDWNLRATLMTGSLSECTFLYPILWKF